MAKTLYFVRHAQGYHNLSEENHAIRDPMLTDLGREQCQKLGAEFPYSDQIDLIVVSPLKRTVYTALISFESIIKKKNNLKVIALPELQETSDLPCDTGSNRSELEREFADYPVDFSLVEDGWTSKAGKFAPTADRISQRAHEARLWLRNRPEKHIVVVTHGGFLHYFTEDWSGIVNISAGSGWLNAEWRAYNFIPESVENASVVETPESRQRRKDQERPLSEAEQRNLRDVATKTWESLGYIKRSEDVPETPSVVRQIAATVSA